MDFRLRCGRPFSFFIRCENQLHVDDRASGIALSRNPSQIHICAINALPGYATIDDGRVAEWFKAPVLKVAGLGVIPYRLVRHSADFQSFPPGGCLADAVLYRGVLAGFVQTCVQFYSVAWEALGDRKFSDGAY
jgi:hypothetical protein